MSPVQSSSQQTSGLFDWREESLRGLDMVREEQDEPRQLALTSLSRPLGHVLHQTEHPTPRPL